MQMAIKGMLGLAGLAFLLAVIGSALFSGPILGIYPEAFSRACNNLALLAIASWLCLNGKAGAIGSP
jgi:hypothetical protein